ncbi:MAG TPA: bi-domain-containing oxidoreductase [Pyrinomonadaceae bacterium]|nr:bi-domain-containing oxidoreductase [Pyrinomonadaceae bacterium]
MKQILQNRKTGEVKVADVPAPAIQRGRVLVRAASSLISAGTERAVVDANRKSLIARALDQPELVKKTLRRAQSEGVLSTVNAVRSKLDSYAALGYSAAGIVAAVGEGVEGFRAGDRVACAGVGYASHAEVLSVPQNLCVRLPEEVSFGEGAYATLGAIALQGVRLAEPTLGESVVVVGLGLLGQLTVQLLRANGCRVFGIDPDNQKIELARSHGAEAGCAPDGEAAKKVSDWTRGRGADAVLITAATETSQPVELAGEISRLKGRVVAVGGVGTNVPRDVYYRRELTLKISMSYGPGRYDPEYEERGHDYPLPYVRWTEGRNLEAFLDLIAAGSVKVERLTTHRFRVDEGERAYSLITGETGEPYLGVLLEYDTAHEIEGRVRLAPVGREAGWDVKSVGATAPASSVKVGLVGAGGYATGMLLPHFKTAGARFQAIATASGVSALNVGRQFGFAVCASGAGEVIDDPEVNLVVIATRHDSHAPLAKAALETGRHVFVEKPLALNEAELEDVLGAAHASGGQLMVGFNRRFSPHARRAKEFFEGRRAPLSIVYRVNAGRIPRDQWVQDEREGGGRIVGEVCHFIDLMQFWTGAQVVRVYAEAIASRNEQIVSEDSVMITLRFADGSNGSIAYLAEGDKSLPKERAEIFAEGRTFVLDDFRTATMYNGGRAEESKLRAQDKGQAAEVRAACAVVLEGAPAPIPLEDLANTTRATFRLRESLRAGQAMNV